MSNAPSKPVSFSRPKVGYFSNRPRIVGVSTLHGIHNVKLEGDLSPVRGILEQPMWRHIA